MCCGLSHTGGMGCNASAVTTDPWGSDWMFWEELQPAGVNPAEEPNCTSYMRITGYCCLPVVIQRENVLIRRLEVAYQLAR